MTNSRYVVTSTNSNTSYIACQYILNTFSILSFPISGPALNRLLNHLRSPIRLKNAADYRA
jgi:hypothetical protein